MDRGKTRAFQDKLRQREWAARTNVRRRYFKSAARDGGIPAARVVRVEDDDTARPDVITAAAIVNSTLDVRIRSDGSKDAPSKPAHAARSTGATAHAANPLVPRNRFTGAVIEARQRAAAAASAAAARTAREDAIARRRKERVASSRRYAERTSRGQPIMAHRARDLLRRVERSIGETSQQGSK